MYKLNIYYDKLYMRMLKSVFIDMSMDLFLIILLRIFQIMARMFRDDVPESIVTCFSHENLSPSAQVN